MSLPSSILVLSQVYVPDPASVGQHMADAASELARRGHRVVVLASARGYEDPSQRYPARERRDGVEIRRLPFSSFGKRSLGIRLLGAISFLIQAFWRGLFVRDLGCVLVSTSPPMCSLVALLIATLRGAPVCYWVMDINPDQAIALGKVGPRSLAARLFDALNRVVLRRARRVITLDRFMAERLEGKEPLGDRLRVLPPWPHQEPSGDVAHEDNPFRREHGLDGRFVFMYSGNHSPSHPISTVLVAAKRLEDREEIVFLFVGGGNAKREVDDAIARGAKNVVSLPYQPMDSLRHSLSAADVHLMTFGDDMVGIVHPCKVYGAMAVGRPIVMVGPSPSHVSEAIERYRLGALARHGDASGLAAQLTRLADEDRETRAAMGERGRRAVAEAFGKDRLRSAFCDAVEQCLIPSPSSVSSQYSIH